MRTILCLFLPLAFACKPSLDKEEANANSSTKGLPSPSAAVAEGQVADSCLPEGKWRIGRLILDSPTEKALKELGTPKQTVHDSSEDDGGFYALNTYRYANLEFDDVRGKVDRILTKDSTLSTPWAINVGITRDSIARALEGYGVRLRERTDTLEVGDCGPPGAYLTVAFDRTGKAQSVQMAVERP